MPNSLAQRSAAVFAPPLVTRGDLLITVGATGILQPEEVVDIGAQVVGRIKELGLDPRGATDPKFAGKTVDYGSPVTQGMVLAEIDPGGLQRTVQAAESLGGSGQGRLVATQAKCMQAEAEWKRAREAAIDSS